LVLPRRKENEEKPSKEYQEEKKKQIFYRLFDEVLGSKQLN